MYLHNVKNYAHKLFLIEDTEPKISTSLFRMYTSFSAILYENQWTKVDQLLYRLVIFGGTTYILKFQQDPINISCTSSIYPYSKFRPHHQTSSTRGPWALTLCWQICCISIISITLVESLPRMRHIKFEVNRPRNFWAVQHTTPWL